MLKATNVTWHQTAVTKHERRVLNGHGSCVLWFTGLSGSGKSSIANALSAQLHRMGINEFVLDGDNIRQGLNRDLGFSEEDRTENIRRIGEVAKLFVDHGAVVTTAFISPFRSDRSQARALFEEGEFIEVFIDCPIEECERRDPKQLYAKARRGEIIDFTGIHSPYEKPDQPEITIDSARLSILIYLQEQHVI